MKFWIFFVVYRQFRIFYTTDLGNSGYLDLHSEPVQREGEGQNTTLHAKFSKKPSIDSREPQGSVSNFDERTENVEWGYFVQNLWPKMLSNIEKREREREGEAQNTTFLNVSFRVSSVPDFLDDGSRQFRIIRSQIFFFFRTTSPSSNRLHHIHPKMPACGAENKIGNFTQLSLDTKKYRTRGT